MAVSQPLDRTNWPIPAAMIQYPNLLPHGRSVQDQTVDEWTATLADVAVRFVTEVGLDNVRTNPCIGNLIRLHRPVAAGFRSAFRVEHDGGDALSVSATNRDYPRHILPRAPGAPA